MVIPFIGALFYFILYKDSKVVQLLYMGTKFFTLFWPVLVYFALGNMKEFDFFAKLKPQKKPVMAGLIFGILLIICMLGLMETPIGDIVTAGGTAMKDKVIALGISSWYWPFALFISLIHSLLEEYYWRWFVYGQLRKIVPISFAHILGGVSFAAHHLVITSQYFPMGWAVFFASAVGIGGMIWSILYEKHGTLVGVWICHIFADLVIFWVGYQVIFV